MTQDVRVRRCELTLRGHGGWGWCEDSRRHVDAALRAIDAALARVLAEADLPDDVDVHVTRPVRIHWRPDRTLDDAAREAVVAALREAVASSAPAARADPTQPVAPQHPAPVDPPPPATAPARPAALLGVLALLGEWSRSGVLGRILASWPAPTVRHWAEVVAAGAGVPDAVELADEAVDAIAAMVLTPASSPSEPPRGDDRLLLVLAAVVAAAGDRPVGPRTVRRAAAATTAAPLPGGRPSTDDAAPRNPAPSAAGPAARSRARRDDPVPAALARRGPAPGLPFLVLVQLARIGYLETVWSVAAATCGDPWPVGPALVGGLAGKVLPPPRRGWSRNPEESAAVHAAAGVTGEGWDRAAHAVRTVAGDVLAPLRSALVAAYVDVGELAVTQTVDGYVVGEDRGALPIAWVDGRSDVADVLHQLGDPPSTESERFTALAEVLAPRRAFPGADLPDLERHCGAVVGAALGSLGVELWGAEVDDAPSLALERLADLEVELRPGPADGRGPALQVAVPLGRRWLDLRAAGLIDRWPMPWDDRGWELVSW